MKKLIFSVCALAVFLLANHDANAQACKPETRVVEKDPIGAKRLCRGVPGDYFNRSLCNVAPFATYNPLLNEIFVPAGRTASCFAIVATTGRPNWKIIDAATSAEMYRSGGVIRGLILAGGGAGRTFVLEMDPGTSSAGASVTVGYILY